MSSLSMQEVLSKTVTITKSNNFINYQNTLTNKDNAYHEIVFNRCIKNVMSTIRSKISFLFE